VYVDLIIRSDYCEWRWREESFWTGLQEKLPAVRQTSSYRRRVKIIR